MVENLQYIGLFKCIKPYINEYSNSQRLFLGDEYHVYFEKGTAALPHDVYYIYFKNGEHSCNQCHAFMLEYMIEIEAHRLNKINELLQGS